jgi:hypothetical protein
MPQNTLDLEIFEFSSCPVPVLKTAKTRLSGMENQMVPFFQTCQIWSSTDTVSEGFIVTYTDKEALKLVEHSTVTTGRIIEILLVDMS